MSITLFAGCSYTDGAGFALGKDEPGLWVNLLHRNNEILNKTQLLNVSRAGVSNARIFQDTMFNLATVPDVKYVFVAWTSMPRYEISLGLETYETRQVFIANCEAREHNLHNITYPKKYLEKIRDRWISLANDHYEILNLVYYVNTIVHLCKQLDKQVFFVNAVCPWDDQYFERLENVLPNAYTEYTRQLLDVDTRDDEQIFKLYAKIHNEYADIGGIHHRHWLNLNHSMRSNRIDVNDDNVHPGLQSNRLYHEQLSNSPNLVLQA